MLYGAMIIMVYGRAVDTYIKRLKEIDWEKYSYYIQTIVKTGYVWKGEEL